MRLTLINDETFGRDETAINMHRVRTYEDVDGNTYQLNRTIDGIPPFHCAYGPMKPGFIGICPVFYISGSNERGIFGDGLSMKKAEKIFFESIGLTEFKIEFK